MGSSEYEMIELFRRINVSRTIALTLACLAKGEEILSQSIEMISGLRQPYAKKIDELMEVAKKTNSDIGNPFFRTLQLLQNLRRNV